MKPEKLQERLLNDVLADDVADTKPIAIAAFRRARFMRRARRYGSVVAILGIAAALAFQYVGTDRRGASPHMVGRDSVEPPTPAIAITQKDAPLPKLTDEELIATFPSNTCFLAEVDGRQILVFFEPELTEKFLHKP